MLGIPDINNLDVHLTQNTDPLLIRYDDSFYQYSCTAGPYINIPDSADKRTYQVCSLPLQQNIKCKIRAVNSAGNSDEAATDEITTPCGGE